MKQIRFRATLAAFATILLSLTPAFAQSFSGAYELINQNSGMVLEVGGYATNSGAFVDQWIGNSGSNQHWTLTSLGSGTYKIINVNSALALEVNGSSKTNGAPVDQWTYSGAANQQWTLTLFANGNCKVINQNSGLALETAAASITDYAAIDQSAYTGAPNQQWLVLPLQTTGTISAASGGSGAAATSFHGFNWADERDNFVDGALVLSGTGLTNSYADVQKVAATVLRAFQNVGANTVRIPINPETVIGTWWATYKGAIDQATASGAKVILGTWTSSSTENGMVNDPVTFWRMWDTVVTNYNGNESVYFEILNEPFGYDASDWLSVVSSWLQRYPTVQRGRVFVGGTGYCADIPAVASSPITSGCLYSVHDYGFWNSSITNNTAWFSSLSGEVGGYINSTVMTEFGAPNGYNYAGGDQNNNLISSVIGFCDYCQTNRMGMVYWPGLRDGDSYSMFTRNANNTALALNSPSSMDLLKYAWSGFHGNGTYQIVNGNSGLALAVIGGSTANGAGAVQIPWSGLASQQWNLNSLGNGYDMIVNQNSGMVLQISGASTANGAAANQAPWTGANNQQWSVTSLADGFYKILNRNSGLALEVYNWSTNSNAEIDQWSYGAGANQLWTFGSSTPKPMQITGTGTLSNSTFQITFTNTEPSLSYTLLATTNLALPSENWTVINTASNLTPGVTSVTDPAPTNSTRFYILRSR